MVLVPRRERVVQESLREVEELVGLEECTRALARLDRLEKRHLDAEERHAALLLRCRALLTAQRFSELRSALERALQQYAQDAEFMLLHAHWLAHTGKKREAVQAARAALRLSAADEHAARAAMIVGLALYRAHHFDWAVRANEKAEAYYRWVDDTLMLSWTLMNLGLCHQRLGELDVALRAIRAAVRQLPHTGYAMLRFRALLHEGIVLRQLGDISRARDAFSKALQLDFAQSDVAAHAVHNNLGHVYRMQGDYARALEFFQSALAAARRAGTRDRECMSLCGSGQTLFESKDPKRAVEVLRSAENIADALQHGGLRVDVLRRQAEVHLELGDRASAERCLRRAGRSRKALEQPRDRALLQRTQFLVAPAAVTPADLERMVARFREIGDRYEFGQTILIVLEKFRLDPREYPWLQHAETEARFYMAAMNLEPWLERLDEAAHGRIKRPKSVDDFRRNQDAFARRQLEEALLAAGGRIGKAAELLGIGRNTMSQRMRKYGLEREEPSSRASGGIGPERS